MKYTITIPEPCHENWHLMTPTEKGRFCASCKKEVLDFTNTSTYELAKILDNNGELCGRFKASQLNTPFNSNKRSTIARTSLVFGITSLLALCTPVAAQQKKEKIEIVDIPTTGRPLILKDVPPTSPTETIKGTVVDSENLPLPGANILLEGTTMGTQTDFDGNFQIKIPKEAFESNKKLIVSYIGFETKEICLNQLVNKVKLELKLQMKEMVLGGIIVVRKWNLFNRIANLFRKKHKYENEEQETLICEMDTEQETEIVVEKFDDEAVSSTFQTDKEMDNHHSSFVWPNPASGEIRLKYQMEEDGPLNIQLLPINGVLNFKMTLSKASRKKGIHEEIFQLNGVQNGLYALIITTNHRVEEHKILVERK